MCGCRGKGAPAQALAFALALTFSFAFAFPFAKAFDFGAAIAAGPAPSSSAIRVLSERLSADWRFLFAQAESMLAIIKSKEPGGGSLFAIGDAPGTTGEGTAMLKFNGVEGSSVFIGVAEFASGKSFDDGSSSNAKSSNEERCPVREDGGVKTMFAERFEDEPTSADARWASTAVKSVHFVAGEATTDDETLDIEWCDLRAAMDRRQLSISPTRNGHGAGGSL